MLAATAPAAAQREDVNAAGLIVAAWQTDNSARGSDFVEISCIFISAGVAVGILGRPFLSASAMAYEQME